MIDYLLIAGEENLPRPTGKQNAVGLSLSKTGLGADGRRGPGPRPRLAGASAASSVPPTALISNEIQVAASVLSPGVLLQRPTRYLCQGWNSPAARGKSLPPNVLMYRLLRSSLVSPKPPSVSSRGEKNALCTPHFIGSPQLRPRLTVVGGPASQSLESGKAGGAPRASNRNSLHRNHQVRAGPAILPLRAGTLSPWWVACLRAEILQEIYSIFRSRAQEECEN